MKISKWPLVFIVITIGVLINAFVLESNPLGYNCGFLFGHIVALIHCWYDAKEW